MQLHLIHIICNNIYVFLIVAKLASLTNVYDFIQNPRFSIQTLYKLQVQPLHIQCLIFLLNCLKEFSSLRLSSKMEQIWE